MIERPSHEVTATRKRPRDFDSLVGQEFVVSTLENSLNEGRIAHAYLFSGPRGVGKTSSARLLARALNCERGMSSHPCGECDSCREIASGNSMDVIEIDGASNTSVNDVRAIREEVLFPPQTSRYKIYIIDEVHMLSTSAFNALLKTIEEPPDYMVFIFATTEVQKVPLTIRSRCQQFKFHLISQSLIVDKLKEASDDLGIEADEDALFRIARESTGSMRDAYTLFDQIVSFSSGHITLAKMKEKLSIAGFSSILPIVDSFVSGKSKEGMELLSSLFSNGVSPEQVVRETAEFFRTMLLYKVGVRKVDILGASLDDIPTDLSDKLTEEQIRYALGNILSVYRDLKYSVSPNFEVEIFFSRLSSLPFLTSEKDLLEKLERLRKEITEGKIYETTEAEKAITPEAQVPERGTAIDADESENPKAETAREEQGEDGEKEEEESVLTLDSIPAAKEALEKMGKTSLSRDIGSIEEIKRGENGEYILRVSKKSILSSLVSDSGSVQKAFSSASGIPVSIVFEEIQRERRGPDNDPNEFSEKMKKLKGLYGGKIVRVETKSANAEEEFYPEGYGDEEEE